MRPFILIVFPLALFIVVSLIFNNALAWQQACGISITCSVPFVVIPSNAPLLLLLTGRFDMLWTSLQTPSANWSLLTVILSLVLGAFLLLISLGIRISASIQALTVGGSGSFGFNEQATKFAQILGIGLLIWGATVSGIGGWESYFDAVAVGMGFAFNVILMFVFVVGIVWQSQTRI